MGLGDIAGLIWFAIAKYAQAQGKGQVTTVTEMLSHDIGVTYGSTLL